MKQYELRDCATLGTYFADVYCDGKLFAMELSRPVAETFCKYPDLYGNAHADVAKLRTWMIESWDKDVCEFLRMNPHLTPLRFDAER